jgi:outer membrane receptor protein involved in Fe transport
LSGSWRLNYTLPLTGRLDLHLGGLLFFTSRYNTTTNNDPYLDQSGFAKVDATIGLGDRGAGWELSLLVRNLTNERYLVYGAATPAGSLGSYSVQTDPLRSFTAQFRWTF